MLNLDKDISALKGAEYNPRLIGEDDFSELKRSISTLGIVKPMIARGNLLVAGHQRTKACRALGIERGPVYALDRNTTVFDEIRFNQLHNGTDTDAGDENARIDGGFDRTGYTVVSHASVSGNLRGSHAIVRAEMCQMILNFGPWGACVATQSGKIIHAAQYALAAKITRTPLTVCVIPDDQEEYAANALGRQYGVFSYDHLERKTYVQSMAQMFRLRETASGKANKSHLYENAVMPWLANNPGARVLDFGSGFGDYAAALRGRGLKVDDMELFRRKSGANVIDKRAVHRMADAMCASLRQGRYDAVVLDSVMNSVDSVEAQCHILNFCNSTLKQGGMFFFSGRPLESIAKHRNYTKSVQNARRTRVDFLDGKGFTAAYRQGAWFYQRYHDADMVEAAARDHGFELVGQTRGFNSWQATAKKVREAPRQAVEDAVKFEFELPWSTSEKINRSREVLSALEGHTMKL